MAVDRELLIQTVIEELKNQGLDASAPEQVGADYDIIVRLSKTCVVRLKVRTQTLDSKSTNNSVDIGGSYDFLIVVVDDNGKNRFFILSNSDVSAEKNGNAKLSISSGNGVLNNIARHEDKWDKIKKFSCENV